MNTTPSSLLPIARLQTDDAPIAIIHLVPRLFVGFDPAAPVPLRYCVHLAGYFLSCRTCWR